MDILHRVDDIQGHPLGHIFRVDVLLLQCVPAEHIRGTNRVDLHRPEGQGIQAEPLETVTTRLDFDKELYK